MLQFITNIINLSTVTDYSDVHEITKIGEIINQYTTSVYAHLTLQFGALVFVLSLVALITPAYFGLYGAFVLTFIPLFFTWLYAGITLFKIYSSSNLLFINGPKWFYLPGVNQINFDILIDKLSITYVVLILSIGINVLVYTFSYFRYEPHVERLFLFINLFMISMCILVLGGNLFVLFLGWELIGLTSFFLINFWSTKISTLKSAFKAFLFNKISDLGVLIFILLNLLVIGESNIITLNSIFMDFIDYKVCVLQNHLSLLEFMSFFLMLSAFIKSAQFGFHVWLPDSMEAPVPASALIHSATLVSAGVFLLVRFSFLLELSPTIRYWILLTSSITAALGGVGACFQSDVKRVLAYSTISHCGFLIFLSCMCNTEVTLLYLCVHGFFKALVFMCIGNVIRFARNYQDFRYMGGFSKYLPFEMAVTLIGLINLGGLPFSFGFFIKHYTLLSLFDIDTWVIKISLFLGMFSSLIYAFRLYYYIFFDVKKAKKAVYLTASKNLLKSKFYSNTTLASCISIIILLITSIIVISYMYLSYFLSDLTNKMLIAESFSNKIFYLIEHPVENSNMSSMLVNWFILLIGFVLVLTKFRYQLYYHVVLHKTVFLFIFSFYLYAIIKLFV